MAALLDPWQVGPEASRQEGQTHHELHHVDDPAPLGGCDQSQDAFGREQEGDAEDEVEGRDGGEVEHHTAGANPRLHQHERGQDQRPETGRIDQRETDEGGRKFGRHAPFVTHSYCQRREIVRG